MADVFISYNRKSEAVTKALADDIEALGHNPWFDHDLSCGQAWWDQILAKIRESDIFVFVLEPDALSSTACMREFGYAADLGKPILPVLASSDISTNLLPPALSKIQFIDYRKSDRDAAFRLARAFITIPPPATLPDPLPIPPEAPISYLGNLAEQVEITSILSGEQQSALVLDLKRAVQDPVIANDAMLLLEKFRKRRDLLVYIADEIDTLRRLATKGSGAMHSSVVEPNGANRLSDLPDILINAVDGYELVGIQGGSFMMGSSKGEENRDDNEGPQHQVQVPSFFMGRYPVTNAQYQKFLEANPQAEEPEYWADYYFDQSRQPVVGVNWEDARAYARWAGLRLPTEAEWEYACRAGTTTRFYMGDADKDMDQAGWYWDNSENRLHPVGEKIPNAFGLHDMHGNVWEWVEDDYHDDYLMAPDDGGAWIDVFRGPNRVIRGGSWYYGAENCRSAKRYWEDPGIHDFNLGFRLAKSI